MNHFCADKDINKLVGMHVRSGAVFLRGKKHSKLRLASGKTVILPTSPSDYRAILNLKRDLRNQMKEEFGKEISMMMLQQ